MEWDDQTRGALKQQVHILPGGAQRQWVGMIRQEVCTQATSSHTSWRSTKTMEWDDQTRGLHSSNKFTYFLEEHKDNRMG